MISPLPGITTTKPGSATIPAARHRGRRGRRPGQSGPARRGRLPGAHAAVAVDAARYLRRPRALQGDLLEPLPGHVLPRRRLQARRGRLLLAPRPRRRRHERLRSPPRARPRSRARWSSHPAVAEAAVVGQSGRDYGRGDLRLRHPESGHRAATICGEELRQHVAQKIGPIARPKQIMFTPDLPKTRSGKIMRRLLRDIADGRQLGDTTTLADAGVVETIREATRKPIPQKIRSWSAPSPMPKAAPSSLLVNVAGQFPGANQPIAVAGRPQLVQFNIDVRRWLIRGLSSDQAERPCFEPAPAARPSGHRRNRNCPDPAFNPLARPRRRCAL